MRDTFRRLVLASAAAASLALPAGCNRNKPAPAPENPNPDVTAPAAVASEHFFITRISVGDLIDNDLVKEGRAALAKVGDPEMSWEALGKTVEEEWGVQPSQVESMTVCVADFSGGPGHEVRLVAIFACKAAVTKDRVLAKRRKGGPDANGFVAVGNGGLIHFPDDKTVVLLHPDLKERYLAGYAKDRQGWPLTEEFTKAAAGHTAFAVFNADKASPEMMRGDFGPAAPLLSAKSVTVALDLKGKTIGLGLRGTFPDEVAAKQAKEALTGLIAQASAAVAKLDDPRAEPGELRTVVNEAKKTLEGAKVAASGTELTVSASYTVDFDVVGALLPAVQKVRTAAARAQSQGNLKQMALALHVCQDATMKLPISGTDSTGQPVKDLSAKPNLSWRVHILPYIEQQELYKQFKLDEPWDSEHNKKLIAKMPKIYAPVGGAKAPEGRTYYQQVIGPAVTRPGLLVHTIRDGSSVTIAIVEAAEPVIWTKPDDVMIPGKEMPKDLKKKFGGLFKEGFNAALWDGSVRFISRRISETTLWSALTPDGGETMGNDW